MRPHEQRVVEEKAELDDKISKLANFINVDGRFAALPQAECGLLRRQLVLMQAYSLVLGERIAVFPPTTE